MSSAADAMVQLMELATSKVIRDAVRHPREARKIACGMWHGRDQGDRLAGGTAALGKITGGNLSTIRQARAQALIDLRFSAAPFAPPFAATGSTPPATTNARTISCACTLWSSCHCAASMSVLKIRDNVYAFDL